MDVRHLFRLSVLFVLGQMLYRVVTQQCGSQASIFGWMLRRHVYHTMMAELGHVCVSACQKDDRCQSFNFVISVGMCEFSDRTKEARPEDFIPDPDRYYYQRAMDRVPLGSIPELPAETCKEIKASEGQAVSGKYWFSGIKPGMPVLAHCDMETEECHNYTTLDSADRKTTDTTYHRYYDSSTGPGWFRFDGAAGKRMASSCPPVRRCGTDATGWLSGGHPSVADGQVTRTVCFHWEGNCCLWSTNIQVRNCSSYYVYYLSGTPYNDGYLRYCGSD